MSYTKTTWVNNNSPKINADNLNNIENGIEANDLAIEQNNLAINNLTPVVLYDNDTTGTGGTVTLSETSANFTYLEIFFRCNQYTKIYNSVKVYLPDQKYVSLTSIQTDNNGFGIYSAHVKINGTTITKSNYGIYWTNSGYTHTDYIYITRVIGYR